MLRKTIVALMAVASVSILTVDAASAQRGGFHGGGGGFHAGGLGGGGGLHAGGMGIGGSGFRSAAIDGGGFRAPKGGGFRSAAIGGGGFRSAAIGTGGFRTAAVVPGAFRGSFAAAPFGGFHHGFRHHRRFPIAAAAVGFGLGLGWPYYYDYADPYYNVAYDDYYYGDSGCYLVRRPVPTPFGWRVRRVQVCEWG